MNIINIVKDFTDTPGGRFKKDGDFSGEEFRDKFLVPLFKDKSDGNEITIIFDGAEGYPTSFLEEAFGGLARVFGKDIVIKRLKLISNEDPLLIEEINSYIEKANEKK